MRELLGSTASFSAFVLASLILCVTPGPAVLYIVSRSVSGGRRAGIASVVGVAGGNIVNALVAAGGLAALLSVSATAFTVIRFGGAAYLVFLGVNKLVRGGDSAPAVEQRVVRDGFVVALLNPKTALFFAAFVPQFVIPGTNATFQLIALSMVFVMTAAVTDSIYALVSGTAGAALKVGRFASLGSRVGGISLIGLGLYAAFSGRMEAPPTAQ